MVGIGLLGLELVTTWGNPTKKVALATMSFYKKLASLFVRSSTTASLTEVEKNLRWRRLQDDVGQFIYEDDGFRYPFKDHDEKLNWADVERITGYKMDLMTTDEICMEIFSGDWKYSFSESTPGWYQLLVKLKIVFPSIPDNWDGKIMLPPFATNFTVLYEREDHQRPESNNFYAWLKIKSPEFVAEIFQQASWKIRKSGWVEWEMSNDWSELHLEADSDGVLLNGLVAFHPGNVAELDRVVASLKAAYQYEFYDSQKQVLLERRYP